MTANDMKKLQCKYNRLHLINLKLVNAINAIPDGDIIKMQGQTSYRLRIGDFRVIFDRFGNILYIEKIDNRGQVYKK